MENCDTGLSIIKNYSLWHHQMFFLDKGKKTGAVRRKTLSLTTQKFYVAEIIYLKLKANNIKIINLCLPNIILFILSLSIIEYRAYNQVAQPPTHVYLLKSSLKIINTKLQITTCQKENSFKYSTSPSFLSQTMTIFSRL